MKKPEIRQKYKSGVTGLFWPSHQQIEKLYKADQLTRMSHHMAVRLLRQLIDQNAAMLTFDYSKGKNVLAFCGPSENEELGNPGDV